MPWPCAFLSEGTVGSVAEAGFMSFPWCSPLPHFEDEQCAHKSKGCALQVILSEQKLSTQLELKSTNCCLAPRLIRKA